MSLRAFHVVFISAAVLLALGLGWSSFPAHPVAGIAAFLAAIGLVVYETWFLRKTRMLT
jgi:uncharacterized oligopeptide transporter (OPT) family protein